MGICDLETAAMAPTSSDSSCGLMRLRKRAKADHDANTNAFALLGLDCLNGPRVDTRRKTINAWIQSSTGATTPQVPFADNNTQIEWNDNLDIEVDLGIEEARLGGDDRQQPLQERNGGEKASRVATSGLKIIRPPTLDPSDPRITAHLAPKWAAASLRRRLLIEQVNSCLQVAPTTPPTDFRPTAIASSAQRPQLPPQQAPGALSEDDHRNALRPCQPPPRLGDEPQNERGPFIDTALPNSLGNPLFDDACSLLASIRIDREPRDIEQRNKGIDRHLAQGKRPGGRQQVAGHQGVGERDKLPDFGDSVNMVPINGGGYPYAHDGLEREPPKAQGAPYLQNAPSRETPRALAGQYISPFTKDTMNPYTKNATNPQTNNSAVRDPQRAVANPYMQTMPTREPPRKQGEFSRVHNALLLDASRSGESLPEERTPNNPSSVTTNSSFLRHTNTPKSTSPFAVVIHSTGPSRTSSNTKYHNFSTYSAPEPDSTDEAPAKSSIVDHRTSSFRVEISSSPKPSAHSPMAMFPSGKKRGRPFATPEAAAKAAAKAARHQLSENGDNTGKKRSRPFATAEAAEKAAKKLKEGPQEEPKKRGRTFVTEKKIEAPEPCFPVFYCEWEGCPAELHNLETLRKHLHILHGKRDKTTSLFPCYFSRCANAHEIKVPSDTVMEKSGHMEDSCFAAFKKREDWHAHLEWAHLIPMAWHLGDGPKYVPYDGPPGEYDMQKSEPWLYDAKGNQVTPSVRYQKLEAGRASFNNGRRYKQQLQRELAQAKRDSLLKAGNKVMDPDSGEKKGTGLAVVLNSTKLSAEDYQKVDVDDDEDDVLALENHLGYEDVFDEEDEEEEAEGNSEDQMMV